MNGIIRWYNQNRKTIWKAIGLFAVVIIVIQLVQRISTQEQKQKQESFITENNQQSDLNSIDLEGNKSAITGTDISTTQTKSLKTLDKFVEYCNTNQMNQAYNLLSEECKKEMYPTVSEFQKNYYNKIFNGKVKNTSVENWVSNIYKVKFTEDALSTGIYDKENAIQDYITIVKDENENTKLNINGYIGKQKINKQKEDNDIEVKVVEKHKYMDFETYVFEITNNTGYTILLNDVNNPDTMYLEDRNGLKYNSYMHEISEADMKIRYGETKKISIKYYNKYSSSRKIENIVFSKIILDYDVYNNSRKMGNIGLYRNYGTMQIKL